MEEAKEVSSEETKTTTNEMSKMSGTSEKQIRQPPEIRKRFILENIGTMDILAISAELGVHERTIRRDIDELKASGQWDRWIENELLRLHRKTTISDVTKYKELAKLRARSITQRTHVEAAIKGGLTILFDRGMEDNGEPEDQLYTP